MNGRLAAGATDIREALALYVGKEIDNKKIINTIFNFQ